MNVFLIRSWVSCHDWSFGGTLDWRCAILDILFGIWIAEAGPYDFVFIFGGQRTNSAHGYFSCLRDEWFGLRRVNLNKVPYLQHLPSGSPNLHLPT